MFVTTPSNLLLSILYALLSYRRSSCLTIPLTISIAGEIDEGQTTHRMKCLSVPLLLCVVYAIVVASSGNVRGAFESSGTVEERFLENNHRKLGSGSSSAELANGKKVALLQVHFEGNVGDQMETIPLLQRLHEWGVTVDCYLSLWMPAETRLDEAVQARVSKYVDHIYEEGISYDSNIQVRNYDLLVVTPGPTVNELGHCISRSKDPHIAPSNFSMAWFGVSVTGWAQYTYERGQKHCVKLIATREEVSMKRAKEMIDPELPKIPLIMSGDISFSYPYNPKDPVIADYKEMFLKNLPFSQEVIDSKDWCMIFSRENNFGHGKGVHIRGKKVKIRTIDDEMIEYDLDKVVFASSSNLEDANHMKMLRRKHSVHRTRVVTASSVEEMFALVSAAPHVVTDRYHPGVASMIVGTRLSITFYKLEMTKMMGLHAMQQFSHDEILNMNEKAFNALLKLLNSEERDKSLDPESEPPYRVKPKSN